MAARLSTTGDTPDIGGDSLQDDLAPQIPQIFQDSIAYHLRMAQEASFQAFNKAAGKTDLRPGWYSILSILAAQDGLTPSELSRFCGRDRSTLTSSLKGLAKHGLIERQQNPDDQRSYSVWLTADGRQMQQKLNAVAAEHDVRLQSIAGGDKAAFLAALARIATTNGAG